jgi:Zn-dependent peptidase ImmA (M78 family)/DNA-binding XRE family transcriptional regulator
MKEIFSIRLKMARSMAGLSMDALVEKMENIVKKNSISKYEKGEMTPTSTVLISLSRALGVKPDYFFRPLTLKIGNIEFRKKAKLGVKKIDEIKAVVRDYIERYMQAEEILSMRKDFINPAENIDLIDIDDIETVSEKIRQDWHLGESPIHSVIELLEYNNVKIIEIDAPMEFDGLSAYIDNLYPIIVLNKNYSSERKRFTALHELGHLILKLNEGITDKLEEKFCDRFAGSILLPKSIIENILGSKRGRISLNELKFLQEKYGISILAIMYRLKDLRIISESNHKYFYIKQNRDKQFKESILKNRYCLKEKSNRFDNLIAKAISEELITYSKASELSLKSVEYLKTNIKLA